MATYNGNPLVDLFIGGSADDVVTNIGQGADVVLTGGGNDTVTVIPGSNVLNISATVLEMGTGDDHLIVDYTGSSSALVMGELLFDLGLGLRGSLTGATLSGLVFSGVDRFTINGTRFNDVLRSGDGADVLRGADGADTLYAAGGSDLLDGGAGVDRMYGGQGDDVYMVDDAADFIFEAAGEGVDLVRSTAASFTLAANVENMELLGGAVRGFGNAGANALVGNDVRNELYGLAGDDVLRGGGGDDVLDGGAGADFMEGGSGGDIYIVDNVNDVVSEANGDGIDLVLSTAYSFTLAADVENLQLLGGAVFGLGSDTANAIIGNELANGLSGLGGDDILRGLGGDDVLGGGDGKDRLEGGEGADILYGEAGEDVLFGDAGADALEGGDGDDMLLGGDGDDILTGGAGADWMDGGAGADVFRFTSVSDSDPNARDSIFNFQHGVDTLDLRWLRTSADDMFAIMQEGSDTVVAVDLNGDGTVDFAVNLIGVTNVTVEDINFTRPSPADMFSSSADGAVMSSAEPAMWPDVTAGDIDFAQAGVLGHSSAISSWDWGLA